MQNNSSTKEIYRLHRELHEPPTLYFFTVKLESAVVMVRLVRPQSAKIVCQNRLPSGKIKSLISWSRYQIPNQSIPCYQLDATPPLCPQILELIWSLEVWTIQDAAPPPPPRSLQLLQSLDGNALGQRRQGRNQVDASAPPGNEAALMINLLENSFF